MTISERDDDDNPTKNEYQRQLQNLRLALQQKEMESKGLKRALRVLQAANKKKTSLYPDLEAELASTKEELSRTQHQLEQQTKSTIRSQYQVLWQQEELRTLKEQHQECIQRLVALEIDLETHDIHFTNYSDQQRRLEQSAMKEVFSKENNKNQIVKSPGEQEIPAQELIAKLMSDYTHLEERYKRDAAKNAKMIQVLEQNNQSLTASVAVLEERLSSSNKNVKFSVSIDGNKQTTVNHVYRQRINDLEISNAKLLERYNETKQRLEDVQTRKVATRQVPDLSSSSTGGKQDNKNYTASLEQQLAICKEQMAILRTKAISYQVRTLEGDAPQESPREMLTKPSGRNPYSSSGSSYAGSASDNDSISSQGSEAFVSTSLRDLREILKRKDRELAQQRENFDAREKELLAQLQHVYNASKHPRAPETVRFFL